MLRADSELLASLPITASTLRKPQCEGGYMDGGHACRVRLRGVGWPRYLRRINMGPWSPASVRIVGAGNQDDMGGTRSMTKTCLG